MGRAERRADVHRFRKEVAGGTLLSYLVEADDARLALHPHLRSAILHWHLNMQRKPWCCGCERIFRGTVRAGAFLLHASHDAVAVSGLCLECWSTLTHAEVEAVALRVARKLMPSARFEP